MTKQKNKFRLSVIFFVASSMLVVSAFIVMLLNSLAWFKPSVRPDIDGIDMQTIEVASYNFSVSGTQNREVTVLCGDTLNFEVTAVSENVGFYVKFATTPLTDPEFSGFFGGREDLLYGGYQKQQLIQTGSGSEPFFYDFNVDEYLKALPGPLTAAQVLNGKIAFLKKFTASNNVLSAIKPKIISINAIPVGIDMIPTFGNPSVFAPDPVQVLAYNGNASGNLQLNAGDVVKVALMYAPQDLVWMPSVTVGAGDPLFQQGIYRASDLNCFIKQKVGVSFDSTVG